jgi:hypothetical protein
MRNLELEGATPHFGHPEASRSSARQYPLAAVEPRCSRSSESDSNRRNGALQVVALALHFSELY